MALISDAAAGVIGAGIGKWSDWRRRKAEIKLERAKLAETTKQNSMKDEVATYVILLIWVVTIFLPVTLDVLHFNGGGAAEHLSSHINATLEGRFGAIVQGVVWFACGGQTGKELIKRYFREKN